MLEPLSSAKNKQVVDPMLFNVICACPEIEHAFLPVGRDSQDETRDVIILRSLHSSCTEEANMRGRKHASRTMLYFG